MKYPLLCLGSVLLGLVGCASDTANPTESDGPTPVTSLSIAIGTGMGNEFEPYADGGDADLVWGFQGGIMITPSVRIDAPDGMPTGQFDVIMRNKQDPAHASAYAVTIPEQTARVEAAPVLGPLYDQVGWDNAMHDSWIELEVTVRGAGFEVTDAISLHLVDPTANTVCGSLRMQTGGCSWNTIAGKARIDRIENGYAYYTFTAENPAAQECDGLANDFINTADYPSASLTEGTEVDVVEWRTLGGCPPRTEIASTPEAPPT